VTGAWAHVRSASLLLLAILAAGCFAGDRGTDITVRNGAEQALTYSVRGVGEGPDSEIARGIRLEPGQMRSQTWLLDNGASARVEARDDEGTVRYCRRFALGDLRSAGWVVVLTLGVDSC